MTHQPRRPHLALRVAAGLAAASGSAAAGQTLTWANAGGGSAAVGRNWNPVQIPGPNNDLDWSLSGSYGVTFSSGVPASLSHAYHRGTVSLTMSSPHTVGSGGVGIAPSSTDNAEVQLTSGAWNVAGPFTVASLFNTTGALTVTGSSSDLTLTGASPLQIGAGGSATLDVLSLASVVVADRLLVANGTNSTSSARVSGSQQVVPFARSSLSVNGSGESRVGGAGDGSLRIDAGAQATFAGSLVVANTSTSVSTVTVETPLVVSPRLIVGGDLSLGRNTSAGVAAGDGSLILNSSGQGQVGGVIHLADDPDGGTGLIRLTHSACLLSCHGITLGTNGRFDIQDGEVRLDGGVLSLSPDRLLPIDSVVGGRGVLSLTNGSSFTRSFPLQVGVAGAMELDVLSGSTIDNGGAGIALGITSGSSGGLRVSGAGTSIRTASLRVGSAGHGDLLVDVGADVHVNGLMETGALANGTATVDVNGGVLSVGLDLVLAGRSTGQNSAVLGGHGSFTIGAAGTVTVGGAVLGMSDSTLVLNGGTLTAGADVSVRTTLNGGVINARGFGSLTPVTGFGSINARIFGGAFTATGPLSLGNGAADGVQQLRINAGAFRVDCLDSSSAELLEATINGGILAATDRFHVSSAATLQGTGTILGGLVNDGEITSTGPSGLAFGGAVVNQPGGELHGTKLTILPGGSFSGLANGGGKWLISAGASASFTTTNGNLTAIGDPSPDGFVCHGPLEIAAPVAIGDSDGFAFGPSCTLRNALIAAFTAPFTPNGTMLVNRTAGVPDVLRGVGTLQGLRVTNIGLISPGFDEGDRTGLLTINANYVQDQAALAGTLELDVEGTAPDQADLVVIAGSAVMDGTVRLRAPAGFSPPTGFRRTVLQAASLSGGIANIETPPRWRLERSATTLDAVYCPPDFNNDGFVDFFDYDDFVNCFESGLCPPGVSADFNDDGFADFFDYDDFVRGFETGC